MLISASSLPSAVQLPLSCDATKPRSSESGIDFDTHLREIEIAGTAGAHISQTADTDEKPAYPDHEGVHPASAIRTATLTEDIVGDRTLPRSAGVSNTDPGITAAATGPIPKISRETAKQISAAAFRERGPNATPEGSAALSADLRANPGKYAAVLAAGYALPIADVVVLAHRNYVSGNGLGGFELAASPIDYAEAEPQVISSWARRQFGPYGTDEGRAEVAIDLAASPEKYVAVLAAGHTLPVVNMLQLERMGYVTRNDAGGFDLKSPGRRLSTAAAAGATDAIRKWPDAQDKNTAAAGLLESDETTTKLRTAGFKLPVVNSLQLEQAGRPSGNTVAELGLTTNRPPLSRIAVTNECGAMCQASGKPVAGEEADVATSPAGSRESYRPLEMANFRLPVVNSLQVEQMAPSTNTAAGIELSTQERPGSRPALANAPEARRDMPAAEGKEDGDVRVTGLAGVRRLVGELAFGLRMQDERPNTSHTSEAVPMRVRAAAKSSGQHRPSLRSFAGSEPADGQSTAERHVLAESSGAGADEIAQAPAVVAEFGGVRPSTAPASPVAISSDLETAHELPHESSADPVTRLDGQSETDDRRVSEPVRSLKFCIKGPEGRRADVGVTERAGEVKLVVRSADAGLRDSLRAGLGDVVRELEGSGLRLETWSPAHSGSSVNDQHGESHSTSSEGWGEHPQGGQRDSHHPNGRERGETSGGWIEELERSLAG